MFSLGQAINYYTCCLAVLGSYLVIFNSDEGVEIVGVDGEFVFDDQGHIEADLAGAGLEMLLNAVALFFMLELDDVMVSDDDYDDCEKYLRGIRD